MRYYEDNDVKYKLDITGGMLGDNHAYRNEVYDTKEEAQEQARLIRSSYTPAQKKYYGLKIVVRPERAYEKKERLAREKESYMDNKNRVREEQGYLTDEDLDELGKIVDNLLAQEDDDDNFFDDFELDEALKSERDRMQEAIYIDKVLGLDSWEADREGKLGGEFVRTEACRCLMGIMIEKSPDDVLMYIKEKDSTLGMIWNTIRDKINNFVISKAEDFNDFTDKLYNFTPRSKETKAKEVAENINLGKAMFVYTILKKMWNKNEEKAESLINKIVTHFGYDEEFLLNKYDNSKHLLRRAARHITD